MKKKIIYYGKFHVHSPNGTYTAIWHLARAMSAKTRVEIVSPNNRYEQPEINSVRSEGIEISSLTRNSSAFAFTKFLKKLYVERKDIIMHFQYVRYPSQLLIAIWCKMIGVTCMITLHDGYSKNYFKTNFIKKFIYYILIDLWIIKLCSKIHFISEREELEFSKIYPFKCKSEIIPNCFISNKRNNSSISSSKSPTQSHPINIVYIGRIDIKHKNLIYQVQLVKNIFKFRDNMNFHIYGTGREKDIKKVFSEIGQETRISLKPPVYGIEKINVLNKSDIFLHPSNWELFGYSILEAIMCGAHAVVKHNADILSHGNAIDVMTILTGDLYTDTQIMCNILDKVVENNPKIDWRSGLDFIENNFSAELIGNRMENFYSLGLKN